MPSPEGPSVPDWFEPGDPWLSTRMRQVADIAAAERELGPVVEQALALFLSSAHARLLDSLPATITAAAMPDLAAWPERERSWLAMLARFVYAVLATIFGKRFRQELRDYDLDIAVTQYVDEYIAQAWQLVQLVPEMVFAEVRTEIDESLAAGDGADRTRSRVSTVLRIDAPSRRARRQDDQLDRTAAEAGVSEGVRREARARLATLRRRGDRSGAQWWPLAAQVARTLAVSVLNAATAAAAEALTETTGERRFRQWWSTRDDRVRKPHRDAHGQTKPVGEKFIVGGFPMEYPGDPLAPKDLTANCRCSLLVMNQAEGEKRRLAYDLRADVTASATHDLGRQGAASELGGGVSMDTAQLDQETVQPDDVIEAPPTLAAGSALPSAAVTARWRGVLAPLGTPSGDNRMIAPPESGEPNYRTLPLPLLYQRATAEGHDDSVVVGNILRVWTENGLLMGEGLFDLGSEDGRDVVRQIEGGFHRWVSVKFDKENQEKRYYRNGARLSEYEVSTAESLDGIEGVRVSTNWRLISATMVAEPAFQEAAIGLVPEEEDDAPQVVVTADAAGLAEVELPISTEPHSLPLLDLVAQACAQYRKDHANEERPALEDIVEDLLLLAEAKGSEFAMPPWLKAKKDEKDGVAMPGGRYPIADEKDLRNAIRAVGRAGGKDGSPKERAEVRRHIIKRAKAINKSNLIPDTWKSDGSLTAAAVTVIASASRQAWCERVADAVPAEPPAAWFADPELTGPVKIRVTDEGRVYGHIAAWDTKHAAFPDTPPPRSYNLDYSKFHRHPVRTAEGTRIKTGPLAGSGHADINETRQWAVQKHYDDPRFVIADVVCGEDEHGIWVSGALRPGVKPFQVMFADRYSFSGDWRGRELLAACMASVPGFHLDADDTVQALAASAGVEPMRFGDMVPRMAIEDGEVVALVAAGALPMEPEEQPTAPAVGVTIALDPEDWGRRAGRGFAIGQEEYEQERVATAERERQQAEFAAQRAEFQRRIDAPLYAEVARLQARVNRTLKGGA